MNDGHTTRHCGFRQRLLADRLLITGVLAAAIVVGIGALRGHEVSGMGPNFFRPMKASWHGVADMVIAGDSRAKCDINPQVLRKYLPHERIVNFGFDSAGYSPSYIAGIERVLDPRSKHRAIVLGITPFSLTPAASRDNGYEEAKRLLKAQSALTRIVGPYLSYFEPMKLNDILRALVGIKPRTVRYTDYTSTGWVAATRVPEHPGAALKDYAHIFDANKVSERIVSSLLETVRRWRSEGIAVYALRVPSTAAMVELENQRSGFDEADFARRFTAAGGVWIPMDQSAYHSYDGSHIHSNGFEQFDPPGHHYPNDAGKLSTDLAEKMVREFRRSN